jgi:hypothetical protein
VKGKEKKKKVVVEEEDEAAREEDDVVIIDKDGKMVEVIPIPESTPLRSPYKQTARIRIGPWDRPTGTLAPRVLFSSPVDVGYYAPAARTT